MHTVMVDQINKKIQEYTYLDLYIYSYSKNILTLAASTDLYYFHDFEIRFKNVFTIECNFSWSIDTRREMIRILEKSDKLDYLNLKYKVEIGNSIFQITTDEGAEFYIIAEEIELVNTVVKYYE